jgi:hypothetical protein
MFKPLLSVLPVSAWVAIGISVIVLVDLFLTIRKRGETLETFGSARVIVPLLVGGACWVYLLWLMTKL